MRRLWADLLLREMMYNQNIYLLVGDLGYKVWDEHFATYPERCINCGASEQAMMGMAVGLAHSGKIPFTYTITSFYLRAAETISLYINSEQAIVKMLGSGRDQDYSHDGLSHDAVAAQNFLKGLSINTYFPEIKKDIPDMFHDVVNNDKPCFVSLRR